MHITSRRPLKHPVRSGGGGKSKRLAGSIGHLADGRIALKRLPFVAVEPAERGAAAAATGAAKTGVAADAGVERGGGSVEGGGEADSAGGAVAAAAAAAAASQSDALWGGHSKYSTVEIEMVNPLVGDPYERMRLFFEVAHVVCDAVYPMKRIG